LLALEVTPCAAPADHPWTDYYGRKYQTDSVLPLTSDYPSKQEAIKRIKPDFIIGVDPFVSSDEQAELRRIAPSYFVPWPGTDWREHLRLIARFLDKSGQAETWLEHYERKVRILREQMKKIFREDDLLILRITGERCNVLGNGSLATVLYDDLRIMPARGVDRSNSNQEIELSELANFDANRMLFIVDEDDSSRGSRAALVQSEIWNSLKSVKGGLADFLPPYPWTEYTAFTHDLILDEVRKLWRDPT
jgi:ABC-type Fe3+-hydroxamate transport system substrate-binding protein